MVRLSGIITILAWLTSPAFGLVAAEPDLARDTYAFLQKHCLDCHGEKKQKADLALHIYRDEKSLLKDRKRWQSVLRMVEQGEMPPQDRPKPTLAEREAFLKAVQAVYDKADRNAKPDPGRVTVRRLNKVEYNNTIRDLVGVDFNPAEDFPSDDVGHGFDNIGDVLTLSPVLMERYLAAAESIMQRAIVVNPPKPPVRSMAARYLEPSGANVPQDRFRPIKKTGEILSTPFNLTMDGEYELRVRCYGKQAGDEPVKAALLIDGKEIKTFEVKAATEKEAVILAVKVPLLTGSRRGAVKFLNAFKDDKSERALFVEWIVMEGPTDTRPPSQRILLQCDPNKSQAEQTREVLNRFVSRAYRRPATPIEVDRLVKLVEATVARGQKWEAGIQLACQAVLVSPKFLFRLELENRPDSKDPYPIDEYQLASRLSYFIWSSMPDQELFDLAANKQLSANLEAQVKRMLKDPRAKALVDNFVMQWLQLRNLRNVQPDAKQFPSFNENLRRAMLRETELFFEALIRDDRSILEIIDANYTYLNLTLARHYGISDTAGNLIGQKKSRPGGKPFKETEFERVTLPDGTRGGILTHASILTVTSNPTRTSPVKRGRWVLEQLMGTPPPAPPPDVPELPNDAKAITSGSLRQRMEEHRKNPSCANCHAKMDAIGFAFENFNAIGAFRSKDGDFAIDPSGSLPDGRSFKGPGDLKAILKAEKDQFARCLAEKMLIYAVGRGLEYYDKRPVDRIVAALGKKDYAFSALVTEIVQSDPFRLRRGKEQNHE